MEQDELKEKENQGTSGGEDITSDDPWREVLDSMPSAAKTEVGVAAFDEVSKADRKGNETLDIDFILDIPLELSVELGRSRILIGELLQLGQGSVLELSKVAGEQMDVYVNHRLIARGDVVVVNEKFGVRLTDIVSPAERINKLA
ncbi:MAG TPA: flagellar motor switch protein FliN [Syntrophales bacterium]|nr:flagellar motor switch protein FliN [Syntrophales bacterium]HRT69804.1 flagellar motor switch protein FliN [Syntrophales bacterium]